MRKKSAWKKVVAAMMTATLLAGTAVTAYAETPETEAAADTLEQPATEPEEAEPEQPEAETEESEPEQPEAEPEEVVLEQQEKETEQSVSEQPKAKTGVDTLKALQNKTEAETAAETLAEDNKETEKIAVLYVAGKTIIDNSLITGETYPGVSYDDETCTLILDNANIIGTEDMGKGWYDLGSLVEVHLNSGFHKLTVELRGENTLSWENAANLSAWPYKLFDISCGDDELEEVTFQGNGTLNLEATAKIRNGIGLNANDHDIRLLMKDCTININAKLDEDDWLMGIRGAAELDMQSAELNIMAEEGSQGSIWGIVNDTQLNEEDDPVIRTVDSKLYYRGTKTEGNFGNYGICAAKKMEFINSDICLEAPAEGSLPAGWGDGGGGEISIDSRTTFQWIQTDNISYKIGKVNFITADGSEVYSRMTSQDPWEQEASLDDVIVEDEGQTKVCASFKVSPGKSDLRGDLNRDGVVNLSDVSTLRDYILDQSAMDEEDREAADLNGDGYVNMSDVPSLRDIIMG